MRKEIYNHHTILGHYVKIGDKERCVRCVDFYKKNKLENRKRNKVYVQCTDGFTAVLTTDGFRHLCRCHWVDYDTEFAY